MGGESGTEIALQTVPTHRGSGDLEKGGSGLFQRGGKRKLRKVDSKGQPTGPYREDSEDGVMTGMGKIYDKILNFSIITRYFLYILPLAAAIAVPIVIGATVAQNATIGGVRIVWFFTWIEVVWTSLWVTKIVVHFLPYVFQFFIGVVSSGTRKYALIIRALEIPLSLVGWAAVSLATFIPLMTLNPDQRASGNTKTQHWQTVVRQVLVALLVSACILLAEKLLIQMIGINYHRKQFDAKIKDSKRNVHLLSLLYDASRALFPMYCEEFAEEDYLIGDDMGIMQPGKSHKRSGSASPMRLLQDVGRFGDKITSVFGNVAKELTGKQVFNPNSAHSIVIDALEKPSSSEALARRIWMSFVVEGKNALFQEDIVEVLGAERETEAVEAFSAIDRDGNGDISLDEMILTVTEISRERKSIANSMYDVDQAISVLDGLLAAVALVICIFVFIAFLNASFVTTLATAGTALLSLSFVFAGTCQEVLGSCIFLFVKHPYDIGDRVDIGNDQLTVEHISLLFTNFKRVTNGKLVQIPNIVLNNLWVENVSRSNAMRETISIFCAFDTPFEDIKALKNEMQNFVLEKDNSRDFQPEVEVECAGIAEMNKMELHIEIRHKSNWANETVRAARRSKFMCALVIALRKVPIYAPGGGDAALGDAGKPSYSVAVSLEQAQAQRSKYTSDKEAKRMVNATQPAPASGDGPSGKSTGIDYSSAEYKAVDKLNQRAPGADFARDDAWSGRDDTSTVGRPSSDRPDLDEVRGLLRKQSNSGKRKQSNQSSSRPPMPTIASTSGAQNNYSPPPPQPRQGFGLSQRQAAAAQPNPPMTPTSETAEGNEYQRVIAQPLRMHQVQGNSFSNVPRREAPTVVPPQPGNAFMPQQQLSQSPDRVGPVDGGAYRPYPGA